ncbi:uncharacterized protein LOC143033361 [Oratosquilla oratoria]|uniref:uncharacterized protein LOC143033361 n=1 Tax=Oratosquilla oratoria TaxID=337810 RepID=UPI003F758186
MEYLMFLLLVLLPTCLSLPDCPEDDIEIGKTTREFPLTGNETIIYFSQRKYSKFGIIDFIVKCSKQQEEITMKIIQRGRTLTSIQLNGKDVDFTEFYMTYPTKMRLTHSEKVLNASILDTKGQWQKLVKRTPLPPEQANCSLHAESDSNYAVRFPCQISEARANLWYLLLLPVFVILLVVLYFKRKTLLKLYRENVFSPADTRHADERMSYRVRRDFGSPEAEPMKTRYGPSDQRDKSQPQISSPYGDIGEYKGSSVYGDPYPYPQECSPCEKNDQHATRSTYPLPDQNVGARY